MCHYPLTLWCKYTAEKKEVLEIDKYPQILYLKNFQSTPDRYVHNSVVNLSKSF